MIWLKCPENHCPFRESVCFLRRHQAPCPIREREAHPHIPLSVASRNAPSPLPWHFPPSRYSGIQQRRFWLVLWNDPRSPDIRCPGSVQHWSTLVVGLLFFSLAVKTLVALLIVQTAKAMNSGQTLVHDEIVRPLGKIWMRSIRKLN